MGGSRSKACLKQAGCGKVLLRRRQRFPLRTFDDPFAEPAADFGQQVRVVGNAPPQLHGEWLTAGRSRDVDHHPGCARPVAQHRLEGLHRADQPVGGSVPGEAHVEHCSRTRVDRCARRSSRLKDPLTRLVGHGRLRVTVVVDATRARLDVGRDGYWRRDRGERGRGGLGIGTDRRDHRWRLPGRRFPATRRRTHRLRRARPVAVAIRAGTRRTNRCSPASASIACRDLAGERVRALRDRVVPVHGRSASSETSSPLWSTRPATSRIAPSLPDRPGLLVEAREDDDLDRALEVLERGDGHRRLGLGDDRAQAGDDPADDQPLPVERLVAAGRRSRRSRSRPTCSATSPIGCSERYSPSSSFSQRSRSRTGASARLGSGRSMTIASVGAHVEQRGLARDAVALRRLAGGHRVVEPERAPAPGGRTR